jgi:hypothetical protein
MIPLAIPAVLSKVPWKLVGYAVGVLAILALGWRVHAWREAYKALPEAQAALEAEVACSVPSKCAERVAALQARQAVISETVVRGYEDEIKSLRDRPVTVRTVRLRCTARPGDVRSADASGSPDGTGSPGGVVPEPDGRDIDVQALYGLAQEADEVAARLRALQGWNKALATVPAGQ